MIKGYDYVVGEILEVDNVADLMEALQSRWEDYIAAGRRVCYININGNRYIAEK